MTDDISTFRAAIDAIDDKLIALLNERCVHVQKVGAIKKNTLPAGSSFIRAGREAQMVRRIVSIAQGPFPAAAAAQLWRIIISASLSLEAPLSASAYAPEQDGEIYWLTREYLGSFTPVTKHPTPARALGDLLDGKAGAAALPMPGDAPERAWWMQLPEGINIFACIPFILPKNASPKALLVARTSPEATGNDISLLRMETAGDVSQSRLNAAFDKQKLAVRWLAVDAAPGKRTYLVEIQGFVTAQDSAILALKTEIGASLLAIRELGAYAAPIIL